MSAAKRIVSTILSIVGAFTLALAIILWAEQDYGNRIAYDQYATAVVATAAVTWLIASLCNRNIALGLFGLATIAFIGMAPRLLELYLGNTLTGQTLPGAVWVHQHFDAWAPLLAFAGAIMCLIILAGLAVTSQARSDDRQDFDSEGLDMPETMQFQPRLAKDIVGRPFMKPAVDSRSDPGLTTKGFTP